MVSGIQEILLVEFGSWALEFGMLLKGIRNATIDWNRGSTTWNLESRIVLDSLTWGDKAMLSPQISGETGIH